MGAELGWMRGAGEKCRRAGAGKNHRLPTCKGIRETTKGAILSANAGKEREGSLV